MTLLLRFTRRLIVARVLQLMGCDIETALTLGKKLSRRPRPKIMVSSRHSTCLILTSATISV